LPNPLVGVEEGKGLVSAMVDDLRAALAADLAGC